MIRDTRAIAACMAALAFAAAAPVAAAQASSTIDFPEQSSGGHAVVVKSVTLPDGGFVAMHDATLLSKEDPFGSVIGVSAFLAPGSHDAVRVWLGRALTGDKETVIAMPHKDTNGNHLYDFVSSQGAQDGPYSGGPQSTQTFAGNIVVQPRDVVVSAAIEAAAQRSPGTGILVDFVDMKDGGFVAVHDNTLVTEQDALGSVVGVSAFLAPGVHHHVHVELDRAVTSGPLIPMAHKDSNANKAYDFVSSGGSQDPPYAGTVDTFAGKLAFAPVEITIDRDADVRIDDQATGGHAAVVAEAYLPEEGFVAIHDSTLVTKEDALGSVVGVSSRLGPGRHERVVVELTRFTGESDTLIAMPHKDTNGNGRYDFVTSQGKDDGPFVGGAHASPTFAGDIVIETATANKTASALAHPQLVGEGGRAVKFAYADFSSAGFVALHDASLLADVGANVFSSVIGVSAALQPGLHKDVMVTLDHPLNASTTIVAMPHKDTNGNGRYDFVSSKGKDDGPFLGGAGPQGISVSLFDLAARAAAAESPAPTPTAPTSPTPASPTRATPTSGGATPPGEPGPARATESTQTPGFELVVALGAAVLAVVLLARRKK